MKPLLGKALRRFRHREGGTATVEFVFAIPIILTIFMASFESGLLMTRLIMLEQSLDMTMRELRLGRLLNPTASSIKQEICDRTVIFEDCLDAVTVELTRVDTTTWQMPGLRVACVDREQEIQPVVTFTPGADNELMLVRVCATQDAMFPSTGIGLDLPKDAQGGYGLIAVSAFVNEPA
jgi:Flp pilus assembly protein TadG